MNVREIKGVFMNMSGYISEACQALRDNGFNVDSVQFDGEEHRCSTTDHPRKKNGSYRAESKSGLPSVLYYNHRTGKGGLWTPKRKKKFTDAERMELAKRMEKAREERETEQARIHEKVARQARKEYGATKPCKSHTYLTRKGIGPVPGLKVDDEGWLRVPVFDESGEIVSMQRIDAQGRKRNYPGGKKKGCYFLIGDADEADTLIISESLSTGISLHEATGFLVMVSFGKDNLLAVAELARRRYPDIQIIMAADNDIPDSPDGENDGVELATAAAQAVGGFVAIPELVDGGKCDFNDLLRQEGAKRVRFFFKRAIKPEPADLLPSCFLIRKKGPKFGLFHVIHTFGDSVPIETRIGDPLYIRGMARNAAGSGWSTLFEWKDPDGTLKRHIVPWKLMNSPYHGWSSELSDLGWRGNLDSNAKKLLEKYVSAFQSDHKCLIVPRTGWVDGRYDFVFPDTVLGNSGGDEIYFVGNTSKNPYQRLGTLEGWKDTIGRWSTGNSLLVFMISAGFAPVLLGLLKAKESFILNYVGDSRTGKTTAVAAASSIWGKGSKDDGFILTWRTTDSGLEGEAMRHNDTALAIDEMGESPANVLAAVAYMVASGRGKIRCDRTGKVRETAIWRCIGLSSGEAGLTEILAEGGKKPKAGQKGRVIDIPADAGAGMGLFEDLHEENEPGDFAKALSAAAVENYGHAGRDFIKKIQKDPEKVVRWVRKYIEKRKAKMYGDNAGGQVQSVADKFLLCAAAGELAVRWGIVPWEQEEAFEATQSCLKSWIKRRGGDEAHEDIDIRKCLLLFLEQHGASRFQPLRNRDGEHKWINRAGFKDEKPAETTYHILPETFKEDIYKGTDYRKAAKVLAEAGLLSREKKGFTRPVNLPGLGKKRCFTVVIKTANISEV